jgi:hypothetical protein
LFGSNLKYHGLFEFFQSYIIVITVFTEFFKFLAPISEMDHEEVWFSLWDEKNLARYSEHVQDERISAVCVLN